MTERKEKNGSKPDRDIRLFEKKFYDTCKKYNFLQTDAILVGFSGGPDSMALLSALEAATSRAGIRLAAFHLNHGIRADEADADERFCADYCASQRIPYYAASINIPEIASSRGIGLEEAARQERYRLFSLYAEQYNFSTVALAHTASDNLETILFHLTRGAGLQGVAGIPPRRGKIIRPLIEHTRAEILAYLEAKHLSYCFDTSNNDITYTRNYIRHEILPRLKQINPSLEESATRFSITIRADADYLQNQATIYADSDNLEQLAALPQALLSRVLLIKLRQNANNEKRIPPVSLKADQGATDSLSSCIPTTTPHEIGANALLSLCYEISKTKPGDPPRRFSLPGKQAILLKDGKLSITEDRRPKPTEPVPPPVPIVCPGETVFSDAWRILVFPQPSDKTCAFPFSWDGYSHIVTMDRAAVSGHLTGRIKCSGDCYRVRNMTKNLRKMLIDAKISPEQRNSLPLVCDDNGPLALPGFAVADRVRPTPQTQDKLVLAFLGPRDFSVK